MKLNKIITIISVQMSPFQKFDHKLIFVILIRYINTKLLKICSKIQKLLEVARFGKSCSKVAEHNMSGPSYNTFTFYFGYLMRGVRKKYTKHFFFLGGGLPKTEREKI